MGMRRQCGSRARRGLLHADAGAISSGEVGRRAASRGGSRRALDKSELGRGSARLDQAGVSDEIWGPEATPDLILRWVREASAMWLEDPNEDEKLLILFNLLEVIGYPSDVSEDDSSASALSTELDSDSSEVD